MSRFFSKNNHLKKNPPAHGSLGRGIFSGVLVSLLVSIVLQLMPLSSSAAENGAPFTVKDLAKIQERLGNSEESLSSLSELYHGTVNNIVNAYMDGYTRQNFAADPTGAANKAIKAVTTPPENEKDCEATGPKMNLSTYCLFLRIDDLYKVYFRALKAKQSTVLAEIAAIQKGENYQDATANDYRARQEWINKELDSSRAALDATLRAYSEVLIQYPMHLEYQKTLKLLIKYYDHLVDVRKKIDTYPARFQDVTTANCT